jgi:uncharacterized membrane protein
MSQHKHARWLYGELPRLVSRGVLDEGAAERLRRHYGSVPERNPGALALLIFGVLGAGLIGLGIILILANNWDDLSRTVRAGITFALLLCGQTVAGFTLVQRPDSVGWREASGLFLGLCAGAAIALIGQTYNIPGDLGAFLMTWMLLVFPLMYLLDAGVVTIGYLAGITWWAGYVQSQELYAPWFYLLAALAAPHLISTTRRAPYAARTSWMLWAACICAIIAVGLVIERTIPGLWIPIYASLFGLMYIGGAFWFCDAETLWRAPLHTTGAAGLGILSLIFTFEDVWDAIGWGHYRVGDGYFAIPAIADYVLTTVLLLAAVTLLVTAVRRGRAEFIPLGSMPVLATAGFGIASGTDDSLIPWLMFNAYVMAVSVYTIARGIRSGRLGTANAGLLLLAALIGIRFFDSDLSFVVRGFVFIVLGIGFLVCNVAIVKRRGAPA